MLLNMYSHGVDANGDLTKLGLGRLGLLGVEGEVARGRIRRRCYLLVSDGELICWQLMSTG